MTQLVARLAVAETSISCLDAGGGALIREDFLIRALRSGSPGWCCPGWSDVRERGPSLAPKATRRHGDEGDATRSCGLGVSRVRSFSTPSFSWIVLLPEGNFHGRGHWCFGRGGGRGGEPRDALTGRSEPGRQPDDVFTADREGFGT